MMLSCPSRKVVKAVLLFCRGMRSYSPSQLRARPSRLGAPIFESQADDSMPDHLSQSSNGLSSKVLILSMNMRANGVRVHFICIQSNARKRKGNRRKEGEASSVYPAVLCTPFASICVSCMNPSRLHCCKAPRTRP